MPPFYLKIFDLGTTPQKQALEFHPRKKRTVIYLRIVELLDADETH